jgi:hypothetical protein
MTPTAAEVGGRSLAHLTPPIGGFFCFPACGESRQWAFYATPGMRIPMLRRLWNCLAMRRWSILCLLWMSQGCASIPDRQEHAPQVREQRSANFLQVQTANGPVRLCAGPTTSSERTGPPLGCPDPASPVLSLEATVRYALENNPQLAALRQQHGIAAAGVVIAKTYPFNPIYQSNVLYAKGNEPGPFARCVPRRGAARRGRVPGSSPASLWRA